MTVEEAIRMIERIKDRINWEVVDSQKKMDALNMAIKSLEAWGKVEADILGLDGYYDDAFWEGTYAVSKIIGKHLSEVSEWQIIEKQ